MKKLFFAFLCFGLVSISLSAKPKANKKGAKKTVETEQILKSEIDSMSYAFGVNLGSELKENLARLPIDTISIDLFLNAFNKSLMGDTVLMDKEWAQNYLHTCFMALQEKENKAKREAAESFLIENAKRPEVITLPSGLQYEIITATEGKKPTATNEVTVHYKGTLVDGTVFDSSYERGEPISFPLNQVIKGWTEGVQLLSIGSKYILYIPYQLAYGEQGAGPIPPFSTLIFTVELLDFK